MSEAILNALVQLFALISDIHDETVITSREKDIVRTFLARHLNNELVARYMKKFEEYLAVYNAESTTRDTIKDRKHISLNAVRILAICEKINQELHQKQKVYVLVQLMDFISLGQKITENELDFLQTVSTALYLPTDEYEDIKDFIMDGKAGAGRRKEILYIDSSREAPHGTEKHIYDENLKGTIKFLHLPGSNTYLMRYSGSENLYLNGEIIFSDQTHIFDHGSSIRGAGITPVFYTEVVSFISEATFESKIYIDANNVEFKFRNSENGIHNLNFHEVSGKLVGVIGGSGVGKSTTLSVLNGTLKPQRGEVLINGYNLYDRNEMEFLRGVIGFVPQDDLLIEDLTVFQNIYFNARMCLNNLPENEIIEVVNRTLVDFDLEEIKDLKVGNPLKKVISGGQRKRINIALELLREPTLLFVDEPTSGLSSVDSEIVMNLLKEQTYKGKLVVVNIHQPSSEVYKLFDKIMIIDRGGYQIYYGIPTEAIVYFKKAIKLSNPDEDQCAKCGNVNTDQILQMIEAKVVDEQGKPTRTRKITPTEWVEKFRESSRGLLKQGITGKIRLPQNNYSIPGLFKQAMIFFQRDFLSKLANKQYILISLLGPPMLALLLSYFTKYIRDDIYKFSLNDNIPAFLFMCVITSLFFGLMISSEEIVKDRKILKRESFLNLSWFSYLNSKVLIMFILSAIQTFSFVVIGNLILGIKGMTISYWLVLFTTSCCANMIGLNLSSAFSSVIAIYIIIPFIIIPQLLFSGVLVKYDKLHTGSLSSREYVPVIGDLMPARWAFEAIAVEQFKNNDYEKHLYESERDESQ
ncbi:MAG: ATP-binding cassette domain-containing protein, partial [Bacteroidales bacterium]|nr:ATP-binding cassette domain-containing protein [Bacteroidales bacterium]